ncbi:hypothetical protein C6503_08130 [Candidatus Poribacteria bacterium]|nr:MAG: hypothetical protein C6503_08130 [Candidatus Poribacteria bacterium]
MVRDALGNLQITLNFTKHDEIPGAKSADKPSVPSALAILMIIVLPMLANQVLANQETYTRWGLPDGAKARIGKGVFTDMQLSPDGTRLAIASSTGVWLYDVSTGAEIALITENTALIGRIAFSPDGALLATASGDNTCHVWNVESQKLLSTFKMPDYWIKTLAFMDDGKTLVGEGIIDKISHPLLGGGPWMWDVPKVWMWDASSGKQLKTFTTKLPKFNPFKDVRTSVRVKAFADSDRVIFAFENKDGTISVKDGRTNREIAVLPNPKGEIKAFGFSPDGRMLAAAASRNVHLWDLDTGEQLATFPKRVSNFYGNPAILLFSKDGKTLAVSGLDDIEIWNTDTHSHVATLKNTDGGLWEFVLSVDGATVITINHHGTVDLWSAQTGKHERTLTTGYTNRFTTLAFAHDGKTIASSTGSKIHLWDTSTATERLRMQLPGRIEGVKKHIEPNLRAAVPMERGSQIIGLAFSEYNTPLAAMAYRTTLIAFTVSGKAEIWDVATGEYSTDYALADMPRKGLPGLLAPDLTAVPMPRTRAIYHLFATLFERSGHALYAVAVSPNGEKLAVKNRNDVMEIWDVLTRRRLCTLPGRSPNKSAALASTLAFTPDGEVLAIGEGTDVHLSHTDTGETFAIFSISKEKPNVMDKLQGLFGSQPFDVQVGAVALVRAGKLPVVAASGDKTIYVWNIAKREPITLKEHTSEVCKLAFSPDATFLASGDIGGTIHLWSLPAGHKIATFNPYVSPIKELVFSPDGKTLASTNLHSRFAGTILLWDVPPK